MTRALILAATVAYVLAVIAYLSRPAAAQVQCGPHDHVPRQLAQNHHEGVAGRGLAASWSRSRSALTEPGPSS